MTPVAQSIASLLLRELHALRRQLELFPDETAIWALPEGVSNSTGTLVLHLAGNLRHFIGARLGHSGYVRDREREFAARDLPRAVLLAELSEAEAVVRSVLPTLTESDLGQPFPEIVLNQHLETGDFLLHLSVHLAYHLGQVDYHRRIVTRNSSGAGALALAEIRTARPASA